MKRKYLVSIILLISIGFIFMIIWKTVTQNDQVSINDLDDSTVLKSIKSTKDKKVSILGKKVLNGKILVFYSDSTLSNKQNYDRLQVGFVFFSKESSSWVKEYGGEYGSIESYLKMNGNMGFTYEFFPGDDKSKTAIIFGLITDPSIERIKLGETSRIEEVNYIPLNSYRLWYKTFEHSQINKVDFVIDKTDSSINKTVHLKNGEDAETAR